MGLRGFLLALLICNFVYITTVFAIIGFDCGSNQSNVTTLSLLELGECDLPRSQVHVEITYMQLLQLSGFSNTKVIQCKVKIRRAISHCGMHSLISIVASGHSEYIQDVARDQCNQIHTIATFLVDPSLQISKLKVNETLFHSVTLAGSVTPNGNCTGTQFSDPYGTWDNVVVQTVFKIIFQEHCATIYLNSNKIQLGSGIICILSDNNCTGVEYGKTFWNTLPNDVCNFNKYEVIYEGLANKTYDNTTDNYETLYPLTTENITFVLAEKTRKPVCSYVLIQTEHPKLLILKTRPVISYLRNKHLAV